MIENFFLKRISFFILFIAFLFCISTSFAEKKSGAKIISRELAVFKIHGDVFLLSDLETYLNGVRFFRCLSFKPLSLRALGLDKMSLLKIPNITRVHLLKKEEEKFLEKILKMLKVSFFLRKRQGGIEKAFFKKLPLRKCSKKGRKLDNLGTGIRFLMIIESFLQNRFLSKGALTKDIEFKDFKKENDHLNAKALKEAFSRKKETQTLEAIRLFINSLDKRIPHEYFF